MRTAITGGIGSGKSYVCQLLGAKGIRVYDCDAEAKRLMTTSPSLRCELQQLIGADAYFTEGVDAVGETHYQLNKPVVARFLMSSDHNAKALEQVVHPAVIADFLASGMLWVESAILFESGLSRAVDRVVVVTAPEEVRLARVMQRDRISREKAKEWMDRQLSQDELIRRADYVIANDGQTPLGPQVEALLLAQ